MLCVCKATDCSSPVIVGRRCSVSINRADSVFPCLGLYSRPSLTKSNSQTVYTIPHDSNHADVYSKAYSTASAGTVRKVTWVIIALGGSRGDGQSPSQGAVCALVRLKLIALHTR